MAENYNNGVTKVEEPRRATTLPEVVGLERNLLKVPMCVLNPRSANVRELVYVWTPSTSDHPVRYRLVRGSLPLPTTTHAKYLTVFLAMFARNWNQEGIVYWKFTDVLNLAGKSRYSEGGRKAIIETIERYMECNAHWEESWNGRLKKWSSPYITECDLWDASGDLQRKNPRNSTSRDLLHKIRLNQHLVDSLSDGNTRLFLTEILTGKVHQDALMIYKFFYGHTDTEEVQRPIEKLIKVFSWNGRTSRFREWLTKHLKSLYELGWFEFYEVTEKTCTVKCTNISKKTNKIPLMSEEPKRINKGKRKGATTAAKQTVVTLTDNKIVEEFIVAKTTGRITETTAETINLLLNTNRPKAIELIKEHLLN